MANGDGTAGDHDKQDIDDLDKEVNPRTGVGDEAAWGRQREPNACNSKNKGERSDAKMKVTVMTDAKLKEMIASIQRAGIAVTSDGLRMVNAKSLGDENEAEGVGQGEAAEGDSEAGARLSGPRLTTCWPKPGRQRPPTTTPAQ